MTISKNFLGTTRNIPQPTDRRWGNVMTSVVSDEIDVLEGTTAANKLKSKRFARVAQTVNVTGASTTVDLSIGSYVRLLLSTSTTLALTNPGDGEPYFFHVKQGGMGGWIVTWPTTIRWLHGGNPPILTIASGYRDVIALWYDAADGIYLGEFATNAPA